MAKQGQHQPNDASKRTQGREQAAADGGSTRASKPRSGRSGSDSNASSGARDEGTPQNRAQSERTIKANDQVEGKGASGAPQGGQINGRQGDQEGQRR